MVEDNKADVFLIKEVISAVINADVHLAEDGYQATRFVDAADANDAPCPDVVLLDLNLPKKSGDEVFRHLRNSRNCKNARVLIVTSSDAARDREVCKQADGYFRKPSTFTEFLKLGPMVKELLEKSKSGSDGTA